MKCAIFPLNEDHGFDIIEDQGWDFYAVLNAADALFYTGGIHLASYEELYSGCIRRDGTLLGVLAAGSPTPGLVRFSVAVAPQGRRQGIAKTLVRHLEGALHGQGVQLEAWVVNPHMARLLEQLGYDGDWSPETPHMEKWI